MRITPPNPAAYTPAPPLQKPHRQRLPDRRIWLIGLVGGTAHTFAAG